MSELRAKLEADLKEAMRSNDSIRKTAIRSVLAAMKLAQVEKNRDTVLSNADVLVLVQKEIKSRKESIADAERANRADLIAGFKAEIQVLEEYLPKQLSQQELNDLVHDAIAETGAVALSDMGKVMKAAILKAQGRAANDKISATVRALLAH